MTIQTQPGPDTCLDTVVVAAEPVVIPVTTKPLQVVVSRAGSPGPQGEPGEPGDPGPPGDGSDPDLPDLSITFENGLI